MKKLLVILSLFLASNAWANIITVQPFSNDSSVTHMENFRSTVVTVINGNIAGGSGGTSSVNILANSVGEIEMADDANPRVRDSELLNIGVDTTSSQTTYVYSGCTPATSANLTSDISACVAYVNGYRISKAATSQTYTASKDTYVDISQTGNYTLSAVANGASAPAVAATSARLAKVVTDGTAITSVTDLARRTLNGLAVATNFRSGCVVSKDSATTITVLPGTYEINGSMISKTSQSTLTISTASDWAGGSSLRAADTFAYVGSDSSGNLKLHTTAPAFDNYALTATGGKKRYASWSSTTYRILGWFYMDGNGSGNVSVASNIKEGDVSNIVYSSDTATTNLTTTAAVRVARIRFYSSGGPISGFFGGTFDGNGGADSTEYTISVDNSTITGSKRREKADGVDQTGVLSTFSNSTPSQSTHLFEVYGNAAGASDVNYYERNMIVEEK